MAKHPQGVRRIRKAAKLPTTAQPVTDEGNAKGLETLASEPDIAFPIQGGRCPRRGRMRVTPVGACATGGPLGTAAPTIYLFLDHGHVGAIIPYLGEIRKFFFPDPLPRGHHGDAGGIGGQLSGGHPAQTVG